MWRYVYLDVTTMDLDVRGDDVDTLSSWLNIQQPISLAVNGKDMPYQLFKRLFNQTALVVYTIGCDSHVALTAQARPQEAEIFGEFPPRHELQTYTKYPMVVPTPGPSYNSYYEPSYLEKVAQDKFERKNYSKYAALFTDKRYLGYCSLMLQYLSDATAENPKEGGLNEASRTVLYGLQRPPTNSISVIRSDSMDDILIRLVPFVATTAFDAISVSSRDESIVAALRKVGFENARLESDGEYDQWVKDNRPWNVLKPEGKEEFPLLGQFVSLLFPLGHVKSAKPNDQEFVRVLKNSVKW